MAFDFSHDHDLGADDARARLRALGEYLSNKYGLTVTWTTEDHASISGTYLIVTIAGSLTLDGNTVRFTGKDPGMLWRGKARDYMKGKLAKYLNPRTDPAALPRR